MNELAVFAGAGGGILGGQLLGWRTICAVELDAYAASILVQRQNDGSLPPFAIWDDVQTFDGRPWRGLVDVVSGGFPCTDISAAGQGAGIEGKQSGLWSEMRRIIGEVRPRYVFVENSPMLTLRGGPRVIADLAALGFNCRWGIVGAHHAGALHKRNRIWIVGDSHGKGQSGESLHDKDASRMSEMVAHSNVQPSKSNRQFRGQWGQGFGKKARAAGSVSDDPSQFLRESDGVAHRLDRLRCLGNGQVPECAALAWRSLTADWR